MVREDLPAGGGEKPSAENIQLYFWTVPGEAHERVVVFVGRWLTTARQSRVVQSQSGSMLAEGEHNMDEADARLVGLDNRLRNCALGLELLQAGLHRSQLILQSRGISCLAAGKLRSQFFALLLKLELLRICRQGWSVFPVVGRPTRSFHQLLLRQHATLQSGDRSINPGILLLGATVEEEKDHGGNDKHGNGR